MGPLWKEEKIILCIHLEGSFVWAHWSADSPPTFRVTVPVAVPAGLLATQVYWPASTSCTPRMRRAPWGTSRPANGVEPTSNSPGNIRRSYRCAFLLSVFCIKCIVTLTYLWTSAQEGEGHLLLGTSAQHQHQQRRGWPAGSPLSEEPLGEKYASYMYIYVNQKCWKAAWTVHFTVHAALQHVKWFTDHQIFINSDFTSHFITHITNTF